MNKNGNILTYFSSWTATKTPQAVQPLSAREDDAQNCLEPEVTRGAVQDLQSTGAEFVSRSELAPTGKTQIETSMDLMSSTNNATASPQLRQPRIISDSASDTSESSLEDLADLLQARKPNQPLPPAPKHSNRLNLKTSPLRAPRYKFNIKDLIEQKVAAEAMNASIERIQALVKEDLDSAHLLPSHDKMLESVMTRGDGPAADKVMRAIKRTEATHSTQQWLFFATDLPQKQSDRTDSVTIRQDSFPLSKAIGVHKILRDRPSREHAILSGLTKELVLLGNSLADEVFLWIFREAYTASRQDLRLSYGSLVTACPRQLRRIIMVCHIDEVFRTLGGKEEAIDITQKLNSSMSVAPSYDGHRWGLLQDVIDMFGGLSGNANDEAKTQCFLLLTRLCADATVLLKTYILASIRNSMEQISRSFSEESWVFCCELLCSSLRKTVSSGVLRVQILRCIPASSLRMHDLRRQIAMCFLFDDWSYRAHSVDRLANLRKFAILLDEPRFKIRESTDYHEFAALIASLDIALDDGDVGNMIWKSLEEEQEFNDDVDILCNRIRTLHHSIHDAGAKYMSRIDAKEILDGVHSRLLWTIRTKPRQRRGLFDSELKKQDGVQKVKQSDWMKRFFKKDVLTENEEVAEGQPRSQ